MPLRLIALFISLLGITACAPSDQGADIIDPNRQLYHMLNYTGTDLLSYQCAKGSSEAATKERATQAHFYFDAQVRKLSEQTSTALKKDKLSKAEAEAILKNAAAQSQRYAVETEAKYKCQFLGRSPLEPAHAPSESE